MFSLTTSNTHDFISASSIQGLVVLVIFLSETLSRDSTYGPKLKTSPGSVITPDFTLKISSESGNISALTFTKTSLLLAAIIFSLYS